MEVNKMKYVKLLFLLTGAISSLLFASDIASFEGTLLTNGENWFLQSADAVFILDLAPEEFLAEKSLELRGGDQVKISGSLDERTILVTVLFSQDKVVVMRDGTGEPLWKSAPRQTHIVDPAKCIACRLCLDVCPVDAIKMQHGKAIIDVDKCINCKICVEGNDSFLGCPTQAISQQEISQE
jgi:ferredoxin